MATSEALATEAAAPAAEAAAPATGLSDPVFRTVRRGYDPEEVRAHLQRVAAVIEDLESRSKQTPAGPQGGTPQARSGGDHPSADPYERVSTHVAALLRGFDHDVEKLRVKASAEAERLRKEARVEAQMELVKARLEADRIRTEAGAFRSSKMSELRTVREHLASSLTDLDRALEAAPSQDDVVVLGEAGDPGAAGAGSGEPQGPSVVAPN